MDFEVEAILQDVVFHGQRWYEVKWAGYPDSENSWVRHDYLSCPELLAAYRPTRAPNTADVSPFYRILDNAHGLYPIVVTNTVDDVGAPPNFEYINASIYSDDVPRPCTPLFPCTCAGACADDCPCVDARYYDDDRRVQVPLGAALMECGPQCACDSTCWTRVVQGASSVKFEIRRFAHKGWGVVARAAVPHGTFVSEYVGELITFEQAEERGAADSARGLTYLFDLDMACGASDVADFTVDAKRQGNVAHFFNHSCAPNMEIRPVYIEHRDPRLHRLAFFAARDIAAGEELTFDYNPSGGSGGGPMFACACGAATCRHSIFM
ncbi:hypothetical protein LPJ70_002519 [Coemansia sp. RSA 2708]|nr:hypothetical protein LPJ70_002519 [Coemansia sp. RSA 2708]